MCVDLCFAELCHDPRQHCKGSQGHKYGMLVDNLVSRSRGASHHPPARALETSFVGVHVVTWLLGGRRKGEISPLERDIC